MNNNFMVMEPTNQTFQELISNGVKYTVPRFQRNYAWELEQWEDLWTDIDNLDTEHFHYMGYIVLQRKGNHDFEIIDGQQRLVTLSLVILAAMKQIKSLIEQGYDATQNEERLQVLSNSFIGSKNPISLRVDNKLSLNRNNALHFKNICSNLEATIPRKLALTNKLLHQGFKFFADKKIGKTGEEIATFIEKIASGMVFTKIVVQDDLNAYKVFETLNARGVQLSTPDLLKNYIFSIITKNDDITAEELNDLDERWSAIISQLGEANFTDFVRYHHNFQAKLVTKKALFKSVRQLADTPQKAYLYLKSLTEYAPIYASLLSPYDEWWANQENMTYKEVTKYLDAFSLFNIKQPFTVLMIAFTSFQADEFIKLVRYMYVLSIRYNVICHHSPNEQERLYNQIAIKTFQEKYKRASHIKNGEEFKKLYPDDQTFSSTFEFHKMPSRQSSKKIRFLLSEIETYLGTCPNYAKTTLEHICPYNPESNWYDYFGEGVNDIQDRLGNVILLDKDELKRANFEQKKQAYLKSPYRLAKEIAKYDDWNMQTLNQYQSWLAEQAVNTWRVD
ncbi:DUF262 domain-containing HNH endonuclease family protein [Candidatus Albibeggiatoa sp. nov. BB20]|uniref:DUF262 domain-containing protein n=1 Tax=Candidatus Albibeggiatoa sp. nov. BB20 TaxID=3162723 RepID=UPI00336558A4